MILSIVPCLSSATSKLSRGTKFVFETWSHARQTQQHEMLRGRRGWAWLGIRSRQARIGRHKRQTKKLPLCEHPTTRDTSRTAIGRTSRMIGIYSYTPALWGKSNAPLGAWYRLLVNTKHSANDACRVGTAGTNDDHRRLFFPPPP